jgi:hypothetical protein
MTGAELDEVIRRFRAGGGIEYSNYHAGERVTWRFAPDSEAFVERTQDVSGGDYSRQHTEDEFRAKIAELPFKDWVPDA